MRGRRMTREEAIEFIAQSVKSDVDMALVADAIKALEQEPTTPDKSVLEDIKAQIPNLVRYESADGQDLIMAYDMARLIDEYILI